MGREMYPRNILQGRPKGGDLVVKEIQRKGQVDF
jgi:hypothetical protein